MLHIRQLKLQSSRQQPDSEYLDCPIRKGAQGHILIVLNTFLENKQKYQGLFWRLQRHSSSFLHVESEVGAIHSP